MPRDLLFFQCFLKHESQGRLMATAINLAERLNPDVDILLIDNDSLLPPENWLDWPRVPLNYAGDPVDIPTPRAIAGFAESIGHFHYDRHNAVAPKDGPSRAVMTGLRIAAHNGYDRLAYMESDSLCALPLEWGWKQMTKPVACNPRIPYGYLDWQVWWMQDVQWLVTSFDMPGKYDWPTQKPDWLGGVVGELQYEQILGEHLEVLPIRCGRGDAIDLKDGTMADRFEEVGDCITHVSEADFATWLHLNGQDDLITGLIGADSAPL